MSFTPNSFGLALCFASVIALSGCEAGGGSTGFSSGAGTGSAGSGVASVSSDDGIAADGTSTGNGAGGDTGFPNDPLGAGGETVTGVIVQDDGTGTQSDEEIAYGATTRRFQCSTSANFLAGAEAIPSANGLVGDTVSGLVGSLGGQSASDLLNSVKDPLFSIDSDLKTASTFVLTASALDLVTGFLGFSVDTLDLNIVLPQPQSNYAVFALSFPGGLVDLGLVATVRVTTYLDVNDVLSTAPTEPPVEFDVSSLDLLGLQIAGGSPVFLGRKVTTPYNRAVISLIGDLAAVDVGEAMYVHEMCVSGSIVEASAQ